MLTGEQVRCDETSVMSYQGRFRNQRANNNNNRSIASHNGCRRGVETGGGQRGGGEADSPKPAAASGPDSLHLQGSGRLQRGKTLLCSA